jgi:hypothetical protein
MPAGLLRAGIVVSAPAIGASVCPVYGVVQVDMRV